MDQPAVMPLPKGAAPAATPAPASRVIYVVDELQVGPMPAYVFDKLGPLHSLGAVEDLMKANAIPFYWARRDMPADGLDPKFAQQLLSLPPGEVFVVQNGSGWLMGVLTGKR